MAKQSLGMCPDAKSICLNELELGIKVISQQNRLKKTSTTEIQIRKQDVFRGRTYS